MAKGNKPSAEKEAALKKELHISQRYEILQSLLHPSGKMDHVKAIYITEDGKYSYSDGNILEVSRMLDPSKEEDAAVIQRTGKRFGKVTLPGKYINRSKVVDEISKYDFIQDGEDIIAEYNEFLKKEREEKKRKMANDPDATAELLVDAIKALNEKKAVEEK